MKSLRLALTLLLSCLLSLPAVAGSVRVAVAANFVEPMVQIARDFEQETGHKVKLSAASTGKLYAQIAQGAPYDVLLAADMLTPRKLEDEGLAVRDSHFVYAYGKLVLWSAQPDYVDEHGAVLTHGEFNRLALADPKLAPYGAAAQQTLQALKLWDSYQPKLVYGENISQAWQFAATGNAGLAFIAMSQLVHGGYMGTGSYWVVPSQLYHPIMQGAVLLSTGRDNEAARELIAYLQGAAARQVIDSYGYGLP